MSSIRLLRERGLRPKKSFGQNFLQDAHTCARIAELCTTPEGGVVLEIGAGLGALTKPLLERAARVVAIERDRDLVPILQELFLDTHLELVEADAVKVDWRAHLSDGPSPRVIAGNLPYQITGRLIQLAVAVADLCHSSERGLPMTKADLQELDCSDTTFSDTSLSRVALDWNGCTLTIAINSPFWRVCPT